MKIISYFILFILIIGFGNRGMAQQIRINTFEIGNSYLNSGTLKVTTGTAFPFKYKFSLGRDLKSTGGWHDGSCTVYIAYSRTGVFGADEQLMDSMSINNSHYKNAPGWDVGDTYYKTYVIGEFDSKVPALTPPGGYIAFRLKYYDPFLKQTKIVYSQTKYPVVNVVTLYNSIQKVALFTKNDCPSSVEYPIQYRYVVPAGQYTSTISQADADAKADLELAQQGQQAANQAGQCYVDMSTPREARNLPRGNDGVRYVEDVNWDPSLSPQDQAVKIELLIEKNYFDETPGERFVLFKVLSENAPNTGKLVGALDSDFINFPLIGEYRIRITAPNSQVKYLSHYFELERDED